MPIDKQEDFAVEDQDWRAEKAIRNVRLYAVLLGSNLRFDKRKEIKEKSKKKVKWAFPIYGMILRGHSLDSP